MSGRGKQSLFEKAKDAVEHAIHPDKDADESAEPQSEEPVEKPVEKKSAPKSQGPDALAGHAKFAKFKNIKEGK